MKKIKFITKGNIRMYLKSDALEALEELVKKKVNLLGIDGFIITKDRTQPSLEHSIDFSPEPYAFPHKSNEEIYKIAKEFLEKQPDDMYFELVYIEP